MRSMTAPAAIVLLLLVACLGAQAHNHHTQHKLQYSADGGDVLAVRLPRVATLEDRR